MFWSLIAKRCLKCLTYGELRIESWSGAPTRWMQDNATHLINRFKKIKNSLLNNTIVAIAKKGESSR